MVGSDFLMVRIASFDDCDCDGKAVDTILSNSKSYKWFKLVSSTIGMAVPLLTRVGHYRRIRWMREGVHSM